jgi:mannose-1-phosphate guanylyltransferase
MRDFLSSPADTSGMTMKVRQAVIMVGGKGTRLRPPTNDTPKPILPVLDRPCLSYLIGSFAKGGIEEVILACGYRSEKMRGAIGDGSKEGITIDYSYEDVPAGTAGAIKLLEDRLDDTFVAANGDTFADTDLKEQIREHQRTAAAVTISLTETDDPSEFGVVELGADGRIVNFVEKPKLEDAPSNLINAGIYIIEKEILRHVPKGQMYDFSKELTPDIMSKGYRVQGHRLSGIWMDVGRPRDLLRANITAAERAQGTDGKCRSVSSSAVTGPFYIGRGAEVTDSVISSSVISKGSAIKGSKISGSLIMADCEITGATVEGSIIGEKCVIRKGAKIVNSLLVPGAERTDIT